MTAVRRRANGRITTGRPGDYAVYQARRIDGRPAGAWRFDVILPGALVSGHRSTKAGALAAARRRARNLPRLARR